MTDDVVAIHESGHALMATVLGFELLRVQVDNDDPRYDLAPGPSRRLDRVRVLMAGGGAERVISTASRLAPAAMTSRSRTCSGLTMTRLRCGMKCEDFCVERRDATYIAAQLARRGVLSGDEVAALVRGRNLTARTSLTNGGDLADHVFTWQKRTRGPPSRWSADPDLTLARMDIPHCGEPLT